MKRLVKSLIFAFIITAFASTVVLTYGYRYDYDYPYVYDAYWQNRTARWEVNGYADKYEVALYKDGRRIATEITYSRNYSFAAYMYSGGYNYYFEVRPHNYRTGWGSWVSSDSFYIDYCREYVYRDYRYDRYDRDYRDRYGVSYAVNEGPPYEGQVVNPYGNGISSGQPSVNSSFNNSLNVTQSVNVPEPQVIQDTINGIIPTGAFMNVFGTWKYAYINGAFATNTWVKSNNKWYYIDINGNMATGPYSINGKTYYLNADGSMATGIVNIAGVNHLFDANGVMVY